MRQRGYFVGFSVTPFNLVSWGIRASTRSDTSHTFLLIIANSASTVFHVDDGRFEVISLEAFLKTRVIVRAYRIPVSDKEALAKAIRWFLLQAHHQHKPQLLHAYIMAFEWAFRINIAKKNIFYCTQGLSDFFRIANLPYMAGASERVVCPKNFENWVRVQRWEKVPCHQILKSKT